MNEQIPTAEDVMLPYGLFKDRPDFKEISGAMIEFAKLHVKAALEQAFLDSEMRVSENDTNETPSFTDSYDDGYVTITVSKDSILNSYPENNIK